MCAGNFLLCLGPTITAQVVNILLPELHVFQHRALLGMVAISAEADLARPVGPRVIPLKVVAVVDPKSSHPLVVWEVGSVHRLFAVAVPSFRERIGWQ
jgi:hypothetical protein